MLTRRPRPRTLDEYLTRAARRVALLWLPFALAQVVLHQLPVNIRGGA